MRNRNIASCLFLLCSAGMVAQSIHVSGLDSLRVINLNEVDVVSTRAGKDSPLAFSSVGRERIEELNTGRDLPYVLSLTPSATVTSDAGNGMGYTTFRVRGVDPSRINVTIDGVPFNDAESSQSFWVNIPDLASSAESVEIQRGVGTSTNGAGAFGGTVNVLTARPNLSSSFGIDVSGGSYGTHKETFHFATGLLGDHWNVQGRLSNVATDGYIDRASVRLGSYHLQAGYYGSNTAVRFVTFNGQEKTYHAWNYTSKYAQSLWGRTYNSCGEYSGENGERLYYNNQTDNYHLQHYHLHWNQSLSTPLSLKVSLFWAPGEGYYEQYKVGQKLYKYGIGAGGDYEAKGDLVNQKRMDNDFYGFVSSLNYDDKKNLSASVGGGWNIYDGDHIGKVVWAKNGGIKPDHEYYRNNGTKRDGNIYAKANYKFFKGVNAFADLQYRRVSIHMDGPTDDFDGEHAQMVFQEYHVYDFFNPKFGLSFRIDPRNRVYGSLSIAHKEPTRNDFEDNIGARLKAEKLTDWELGYKYQSPVFTAGVNLYMMNYANQFVLTGRLNEIGEMIASNDNSGKSYRTGVELEAAYRPTKWFRWDANATFSRNRNKNWTVLAMGEDWAEQGALNLGDTPTSFSPDLIFNNVLTFQRKGFKAMLISRYVGKQYLTNTGFDYARVGNDQVKMILSDHFTNDIDLSYTFKVKSIKRATVGVTLYNLTSLKYDNNGWAYCEVGRKADGQAYAWTTDLDESGFAPQAPFHAMAHLSLQF